MILLGRRKAVVKEAAEKLGTKVVKEVTEVVLIVCDILDLDETERL